MDSRHSPLPAVAHEAGNDDSDRALPLVSNVGDWPKQTMTVVILDLVSDRRERRVSGIHASALRKPETANGMDNPSSVDDVSRCVNPITALHGEKVVAGR
jgi:hypothetical protein